MTYSDEMRADDEATLSERRAQARDRQVARRADDATKALKLKDKGCSNAAIAQELGLSESTVRVILDA